MSCRARGDLGINLVHWHSHEKERKKKISENILWSKSKYYFMKLLFQVFKKNI